MSRKISVLFVVLLFAFIFSTASYASDSRINDININVNLDDDGTAHITEKWDVNVTSGTEWYLVQGNLGDIKISDFSVSDETGTVYTNEGAWNVDRSISQKAKKCGIVDKGDGSYELCWGVGSYGNHVFIVSYTMSNFVKQYSDYNGFNQRLVNDELSSAPEHVKVIVYKEGTEFTSDDTKVWAFGFEGTIFVEDGKVVAESTEPFNASNYVNVMVRFNPDMFHPTSLKTDQAFEKLKKNAFEDSDYNYNYDTSSEAQRTGFSASSFFTLFIIACVVSVPWLIKRFGKSSTKSYAKGNFNRAELKNIDYSRKIPFDGNLTSTYHMLKMIGEKTSDGALIGAYLLRWMQNGTVRIEETERKGFLGIGNSMQPSVVFLDENTDRMENVESSLYNLLKKAAGFDSVLQEKELYKWAQKNYEEIDGWLESADFIGAQNLELIDAEEISKQPILFGLIKVDKNVLTQSGKKMAIDMMGFKKYLEDFTIINEREPAEVGLWNDYLVYAALFGIADKVAQQFKNIYPQYFEQPYFNQDMTHPDVFTTMIWINAISNAGHSGAMSGRMEAQAQAASGGGGFSSMGGGGGFSGGGSGGGSR